MATTCVVRHCKQWLVLLSLSFLSSCSLYSYQAENVHDALMNDQLDLAYAIVQKKHNYYDSVLKHMNKGMLLRMKHDYIGSNKNFEKAKKRINKLHGLSISEQVGSVFINDLALSYKGTRVEQLLLHAYMAMNYIDMGDLDDARVEMLQADVKMHEWGDHPDDDPFIKYLSGMIYQALDENDQAVVAYRDAVAAYKANRDKQNLAVPMLLVNNFIQSLLIEGLDDEAQALREEYPNLTVTENQLSVKTKQNLSDDVSSDISSDTSKGELIVILSNGLSPIKSEDSITIFADEIEKNIRVALPAYRNGVEQLNAARIEINQYSGMLETIENVDGLARSALEHAMPKIIVRAIARAVVKHKTQHQKNGAQTMGSFLMSITNLVTERADTRSWSTLPQKIQMTRHVLPVGKYPLQIEIVNNAGFVVDRIKREVEILSGKITFIFEHWVSPRVTPLIENKAIKLMDKPTILIGDVSVITTENGGVAYV